MRSCQLDSALDLSIPFSTKLSMYIDEMSNLYVAILWFLGMMMSSFQNADILLKSLYSSTTRPNFSSVVTLMTGVNSMSDFSGPRSSRLYCCLFYNAVFLLQCEVPCQSTYYGRYPRSLFKLKQFVDQYFNDVPTNLKFTLTRYCTNESNELYMLMCQESFVCMRAVERGYSTFFPALDMALQLSI